MCLTNEHFPTSEEERRIQIAREVYGGMAGFSLPNITAVAKVVTETEGEFVGSGSFMVFNGQVLLVTAAHVINQTQIGPTQGAAFSNGHRKPFQRVASTYWTDQVLDIAIAPVHLERPPASACLACPSSHIAQNAGSLDDLLFVHGFPGEYSRFSMFGPGFITRPLPYGNIVATPTWTGFNPGIHFAMGFDPRHAEYSDGSSATLPNPGGMSGSVVWNTRRREVGNGWQSTDARVVGVIHRWDQDGRCLIGTRIEHIHGIVAAWLSSSQKNEE